MASDAMVAASAATISACSAFASSLAAWFTIRGRRPKLTVVCSVGNPDGGGLKPNPTGVAIGVRVTNVRDTDVEVIDLSFKVAQSRVMLRWPPLSRPPAQHLWPPTEWFAPAPGDQIPGTIRAHHTAMYAFRMEELGAALLDAGETEYHAVIECPGGKRFRSAVLAVSEDTPTAADVAPVAEKE